MHPPVVDDRVPLAESHAPMPFAPYVPATQSMRELTARGLLLGSLLGVLFAASSVYLSVKVGLTVSASIPVAVLSIAVFHALGRSSILENCIVQTTGSAGESLAFGIATAIPALLFMGYDMDLWHALLVALIGGVLGVLMMIPLRHGLIVQEHGTLTYPEGTACAEVLIAGDRGGTTARLVIGGFLIGAIYKVLYAGLKLWREVIGGTLGWVERTGGNVIRHGFPGASVAAEISPELLGVGYIIGPKVAGVTVAGGVLSYLILIPAIQFFGEGLQSPLLSAEGLLIRNMTPDELHRTYVLYVGAGAVATGGLISLIRSLPTIVSAFRRALETFLASRGASGPLPPRTDQDLPITVVVGGSAALVLACWWIAPLHLNLLCAVLIVIGGFFFSTVSARITGEIGSSSNPISGMVVATLLATCLLFLLLGWTSPVDRFAALTTAAIVGMAASNAGTTAQDLKTAYLVGGTPRRQQVALFVGVITSALCIGPVLLAVNRGAMAIVPEAHPGQPVTHPSEERVSQLEFSVQIDAGARGRAGVSEERLARDLWAMGWELRSGADVPSVVRSFRTDVLARDLERVEVRGDAGPIPFGQIARVGAPTGRLLHAGFVRNDAPIPTGKYLSDDGGRIEYVVDPGIGGRVDAYRGKKLTRYEAPKARLFSLIIDGILTRRLPWELVLLGVFISLMLELCGVASLPFAVGVYLPISTTTPIFVGGVIRFLVDRRRGGIESESSPGTLLASGYIAGGSIAGVIVNLLNIPAGGAWIAALDVPARLAGRSGPLARLVGALGESDRASPLWATVWGLLLFGLLGLSLFRTATARVPAPSGAPRS